ncbi:VIT and vWA domain-containing protein [Microbulbifer hydrolyticus]|uniref:Ca-activated chloride channel family protein n=1 Tax=Microbulbifer hydrolyticus TaxID=48074 RepID=A0A6P1TC14_9GAMM|nr:VIT domain-containing protein [Microbulbifer hydrolyticus]MBB5210975.1 Ca-activated chloride channel family protein [Microbulbifer hydrolyticus]QHQ38212.1 VWA domain-containing protein [Microbulbifer hydrolyticus]
MQRLWKKPIHWFSCLLLGALAPQLVAAAGLLTPADGSLPALEIREHHVNVVIDDGYAITEVDQTFYNPNDRALEAVYSFPVPEKASVGEFTYWIDGNAVTGEVLPKQQARTLYEQEKAQGRRTALTEQDEYRSFDSRVYPVQPNDTVRIRLVYIQPVHAELGIGRYVYPLEEGGVDEERMAFFTYQEHVQEAFSFNLSMRSSYPIDQFLLPAHPQAQVQQQSGQEWKAAFANTAGSAVVTNEEGQAQPAPPTSGSAFTLDKDIVVYWRHQQGLPGAVDMVTYRPEGSDRGTFMLTLTPGDDLGTASQGRDWTFVLDMSGSMAGKYHSLAEGVRKGLGKLPPTDRFRIVLFNDQAQDLTSGFVPVTDSNVNRYLQQLESLQPSGGTNLFAGLKSAYEQLDADRPSAVILVTDGVANVGVTAKKAFLKLLEQHDIRLFTFVMGNSANRPLLDGMARVSNGFAMAISNSDDISGRLVQAADKLRHESYRDIDVRISGVKVRDLTPQRIGSLYRGQQLIVFGHYWGDGAAKLTIDGKVSEREVHYTSDLKFPATDTRNPELERLWAYATIEDIQNKMDYLGHDADSEDAIVDLAVEHGLVTPYTSLVVVEEQVFEQQGIKRNNKARVDRERAARQNREAAPIQDHRQDSAQPAFNGSRAYPRSSGGSAGPILMLLLLLVIFFRKKRG